MSRNSVILDDLPPNTDLDPELAIEKVQTGYRQALAPKTMTTVLDALVDRIEELADWEKCHCKRPSRFAYQLPNGETWQVELVFANETFDLQLVRDFRSVVREYSDIDKILLILAWTEHDNPEELCHGVPGIKAHPIGSLIQSTT